MTKRIRLRRRSLEDAPLEEDDHKAQADRSYIDTNITDPEWMEQEQYGVEHEDACSSQPCHNGGQCVLGRAIHGFAAELLDDEDNIHFDQRNTTFHCKCPPGWTGLACEIKLVECPANQTCFNERKCLLSEDDYGTPFRHCECDAYQTDFSLPYVAHFCGQTATVSCSQRIVGSGSGGSHSFCKNGGKCRNVLTTSQQA